MSKRIKSSKLTPLRDGEQSKRPPQPLLKRPSRGSMSGSMSATQNLGQTGAVGANLPQTSQISMKKTHIRTSYPKLMSAKRTMIEEENKTINPAKIEQREYLNRFTRVQDLDKQKQIKFSQFLGDKAMTEE